MKHKLKKTENYLLVVDESEIKEGDYVLTNLMEIVVFNKPSTPSLYKKIIAHLPINKIIAHLPINAPILKGVPLLPPIEDEVEKLALINVQTPIKGHKEQDINTEIWISGARQIGFIEGYNKAKKKYKYTEKDMLEFAIWRSTTVFTEPYTPLGEFILWESLQQPKLPVAFECEMKQKSVNGSIPVNQEWEYEPKTTTNSQGQTQLVGTYIYE